MKDGFLTIVIVSILSMLSGGCAVNPVSGQNQFVLMSEDQEIAIGRQTHAQVLEKYGYYDDPALQAYVRSVGEKLARVSHRDNLVYRFTVVDSPEVNAFALPGGYIYITRGMMAYLNSEAELAAVLGHEIGHVTARHAVERYTQATTAQVLGAVVGVTTGVSYTQDLVNIFGAAIVSGFGRENELESDRLGAEYLAQSGYDPQAMIRVIETLKAQEQFELKLAKEENRDPRVYHGLFSTHPANDKRLQEAIAAAGQWHQQSSSPDGREVYLRNIDGMTFGDSAREGIRRGNRFYHSEMGIVIDFPQGWKVDNLPDHLLAKPVDGNAALGVLVEDINRRITPEQFIEQRLNVNDLQYGEAVRANSLSGYTGIGTVNTPFGKKPARISVIYLDQRAYIFIGSPKINGQGARYDAAFLETANSLRPLAAGDMKYAEPLRIRLIRASQGSKFTSLALSSNITNSPEAQLRLINGMYPDGEPHVGQVIKIVE